MSATHAAGAPIAIFADLEADLWGVVIGGGAPRAGVAGLTDADVVLRPAELDLDDGEVWELTGAGCALRIEGAEATTATAGDDCPLAPCRVSGAATIAGAEREFYVGGTRSPALTTTGIDSLRLLGTWFPAGHQVALLSVRPTGAKGQDHDAVGVIACGEEHALVFDPRLSTTYDQHGAPLRTSIELWLADDEDGAQGEQGEQWPRRVAGTATGSRVAASGVSAHAFTCSSRGESGAGVYLLAGT